MKRYVDFHVNAEKQAGRNLAKKKTKTFKVNDQNCMMFIAYARSSSLLKGKYNKKILRSNVDSV